MSEYILGFENFHAQHPDEVGDPLSNEGWAQDRVDGHTLGSMQESERGLLVWSARHNRIVFADFERGVFLMDDAPVPDPAPEPPPPPPPPDPQPAPEPRPAYNVLAGNMSIGPKIVGPLGELRSAGIGARIASVHQVQVKGSGWDKFDAIIRPYADSGIRPLVGIDWGTDVTQPAPADFVGFVGQVAVRYPFADISAGNEPKAPIDPVKYGAMLRACSKAVADAGTGAWFVGPELQTGQLLTAGGFGQTLLKQPGVLAGFGALALHAIPLKAVDTDVLTRVRNGIAAARKLGYAGPIWFTEVGYSAEALNQQPEYPGEQGQADWLEAVLPKVLEAGAARVFWALLSDNDREGWPNGLLRENYSKRPSWDALTGLAAR